ncbi:MAG: hypothetical protein RR585_07140 [Coprobacillus sp.]
MLEIEELNRIDKLIIDALKDLLLINEGSIEPVNLIKVRMILKDMKHEIRNSRYQLNSYDQYFYSYLTDCRDDVKKLVMIHLDEKNERKFNEKINSKLFTDDEIKQIIKFIIEREESII